MLYYKGGDYVLVVKFSGGDYVLVVKFSGGGGDYVLASCKIHGGDYVHVYKNGQGGFVRGGGGGGIVSLSQPFQVIWTTIRPDILLRLDRDQNSFTLEVMAG